MATKHLSRAHWRKRVLIPFWILHLFCMTILLGALVLCIFSITTAVPPIATVELVFCVISMILDITEIILYDYHSLGFLTYLVFQIVKTTFWTIMVIIAIVTDTEFQAALARDGFAGTGTLVLLLGVVGNSILLLVFIGSLIYGSIIYHRYRHSDHPISHPYTAPSSTVEYHNPASAIRHQNGGSPMVFSEDLAPRYEDARLEGGGRGDRAWGSRGGNGAGEWRKGGGKVYELSANWNIGGRR